MPTRMIFPMWPRSSPASSPSECRNRHRVHCSNRPRKWSLFGRLSPLVSSRMAIPLEVIPTETQVPVSCWTTIPMDRTLMAPLDHLWGTTTFHRPMTTCLQEMLHFHQERYPRDTVTSCLPPLHRHRWSNPRPCFGTINLRYCRYN